MDALLTRKTSQQETGVETLVAMKDAHRLLNMKLRQDVTSAQEDISTFVEDTSLALDSVTLTTGFSLGGGWLSWPSASFSSSCVSCVGAERPEMLQRPLWAHPSLLRGYISTC